MEIIVCIKQVPDVQEVAIDPETGVLQRAGVEAKMNPYDLYALEAALRLKERVGGRVRTITMGPPQAEAVIRESFMMGADAGVLLTDPKFAGADTLATAFTLSQGIQKMGPFDLILCGMQTTDGDTGQVGPGIAEFLHIPHVAYVGMIDPLGEGRIGLESDMGDWIGRLETRCPCLLTVTKGVGEPRLPSFRRKLATKDWPVTIWSAADLPAPSEQYYGLAGSPTQVERIFPPQVNDETFLWEGNPDTLAQKAYAKLAEFKLWG